MGPFSTRISAARWVRIGRGFPHAGLWVSSTDGLKHQSGYRTLDRQHLGQRFWRPGVVRYHHFRAIEKIPAARVEFLRMDTPQVGQGNFVGRKGDCGEVDGWYSGRRTHALSIDWHDASNPIEIKTFPTSMVSTLHQESSQGKRIPGCQNYSSGGQK